MTAINVLKNKIKYYEDRIQTLSILREGASSYEERTAIYENIAYLYDKIHLIHEILHELVAEGGY